MLSPTSQLRIYSISAHGSCCHDVNSKTYPVELSYLLHLVSLKCTKSYFIVFIHLFSLPSFIMQINIV